MEMFLRALIVPLLSLVVFVAPAGDASAGAPLFHTESGIAIGGYDPVAYFTEGIPVPGRPDIQLEWKGAVWRFASQANRARFEANPRAYAPQYGGYCAYAMARGYLDSADPRAWKIVNGRLYLVHSFEMFRIWARDIPGNLALAEANWPAALRR